MNIHSTPAPNVYINNNQQVESMHAQDDSIWDRKDVAAQLKLLVLKYRIQKVTAKNEKLGVRTDVSITDLSSGMSIMQHNEDDVHFAASINKLPVALLLLEDLRANKVSLDQTMTWLPSDVRAGFGVYDQPGAPTSATLGDVLYDMLNHSGNTAVRVVVNGALSGPQAVNDRLASKPELVHTRLIPLDATRFFLGDTTSKESLWVLTELMKTQDAPASFIRNALAANIFTDFGVRSQLAGNDFVVLVNKIGLLDDVDGNNRHDVGIIYNIKTHKSYAYALLTTAPFNDTDPSATEQANESLMDMGRPLLRFAGDKKLPSQSALYDSQALLKQLRTEHGRVLY
jgi:beta-lactamase class A